MIVVMEIGFALVFGFVKARRTFAQVASFSYWWSAPSSGL